MIRSEASVYFRKPFLCLVLLLCGLGVHSAHADHVSSTEMYVDYIGTGPTDYRYKVTLVTFRICIQNNLELFPTATVRVKSTNAGQSPGNDFFVTLTNEVLRYENGLPVYEDTLDNLCPDFSAINSCRVLSNVNYSGYTMRRYSNTVVLPSRQTDWRFSWTTCCRLLSYINIDYNAGAALYLEVGLNNLFRHNNSTPRFRGQPFAFLCANQRSAISNLPADPNPGDSIVTEKIDPQQSAVNNIVYNTGFSSSGPMGTSGNYTVGKTSGKATFIPPSQGRYALGFRTSDYDKATGVRMSYASRDLVATVLNCTHLPPFIDSIPQSTSGIWRVDTTAGEIVIRACQLPLSFIINAHSNMPNGLIYMRPASTLPPGMTIKPTITGGTGFVTINWMPRVSDIGTHVISLIAIDSTCIIGQEITFRNEFTFTIVIDSTRFLPSNFTELQACDKAGNRNALSSSTPRGSYSWSTGETTQTIYPAAPGYYVCKALTECTVATDSFLVTASEYDSLYHVPVCDAANVRILITSPTVSPYYAWSTGESSRQIEATKLGDFTCRAFNGCDIIHETHRVEVGTPHPPMSHDTVICQYTSVPIIQMKDIGLVWYPGSSGGVGNKEQPLINTSTRGQTTLYVAKKNGNCVSERVPVHITIFGKPKAQAPDTLLRCNGVINYAAPIGNAPESCFYYAWSTGTNSSFLVPKADGQYYLRSYNWCGEAVDTFTVKSDDCENCVRFPDAFSPNDDGLNDAFGPVIMCQIDRFSLTIYNRWGQIVYTSRDRMGRWRGTHNGVPAPGGVYMYMASMYSEGSGKRLFIKGEVSLIR